MPTASAVVADIVDCVKHLKRRKFLFWVDGDNENILPYDESRTAMYVRVEASKEGELKKIFGNDINVISNGASIAAVTPVMSVKEFEEKTKSLRLLSKIRVGDL